MRPHIATQGWTSGNNKVDSCIKEFQLNTTKYKDVIEWIPFNKLNDIQTIGEGGFGTVFSARWLDGKRISDKINYRNFMQQRTLSYAVGLKTLHGSVFLMNSKILRSVDQLVVILKYMD